MEVLLVFQNSRRVITVAEGQQLLAAVERDIGERFPDRDIAVAAVGDKVPQSTSKEVYMLQKRTEKWGYVDITDISQVCSGDELTLTKVSNRGETSTQVCEGRVNLLHE